VKVKVNCRAVYLTCSNGLVRFNWTSNQSWPRHSTSSQHSNPHSKPVIILHCR